MAIKNKDGSTYSFTKPAPQMIEQVFWNKQERVSLHNKFGQRFIKENVQEEPVEAKIPEYEEMTPPVKEEIKIIKHMDNSDEKPKTLSADIVDVWCLPCLERVENVDPLYGESYEKVNYGEKFTFKARLFSLEDLQIEFITEGNVILPYESVVYPKVPNRRWWQIKGYKEVKGYRIYIGVISDYQPSFV
jgi:hypothetical protein